MTKESDRTASTGPTESLPKNIPTIGEMATITRQKAIPIAQLVQKVVERWLGVISFRWTIA